MADSEPEQTECTAPRIVNVQDLSARELVRLATTLLPNVAEEFEDWRFLDEQERRAAFEPKTKRFEHHVQTADVCRHFLDQGFDGNVAAFIQWIIVVRPQGWFASLPSTPGRLWRNRSDQALCAPCFLGGDLSIANINDHWSSSWTFVAFRRVT